MRFTVLERSPHGWKCDEFEWERNLEGQRKEAERERVQAYVRYCTPITAGREIHGPLTPEKIKMLVGYTLRNIHEGLGVKQAVSIQKSISALYKLD